MNSDNANITGYALDIEFKGICDYADSSDNLTSMEDIPFYDRSIAFVENSFPHLTVEKYTRFSQEESLVFDAGSFAEASPLDLVGLKKLKVLTFGEGVYAASYNPVLDDLSELDDVIFSAGNSTDKISSRSIC